MWRKERSGSVYGKAAHCFDVMRGAMRSGGKGASRRKKLGRKALSARLNSLQKIVITSLNKPRIQ